MQSVQCASCIKQEPPDDDELEAMSSDTDFTASPQDPLSPSIFQTVEPDNNAFQRPQCQKYYKTAASLSAHKRQHHSGERTCNQCQPPITFKSAQALATHNRSHHSGESQPISPQRTCNQCQPRSPSTVLRRWPLTTKVTTAGNAPVTSVSHRSPSTVRKP